MIRINLTGPQGNAFCILGAVDKALDEKGCTQEQRDEYHTNATSSNYDNLLDVSRATLSKFGIKHDIEYHRPLNVDDDGLEEEYDGTRRIITNEGST